MAQGWRITTINGLLLACYFVPTWFWAAFQIAVFPIRGIYATANIGPALFVSDSFHFSVVGTVRFAWLLVLAKIVVVAFLLLFAVLTCRRAQGGRAGGDEALALALLFASVISITSMMAASVVGELAAVRLHATESLMLLGGFVLLAVDSQCYGVKRRDEVDTDIALAPKSVA